MGVPVEFLMDVAQNFDEIMVSTLLSGSWRAVTRSQWSTYSFAKGGKSAKSHFPSCAAFLRTYAMESVETHERNYRTPRYAHPLHHLRS
jgi:hypothetical protein